MTAIATTMTATRNKVIPLLSGLLGRWASHVTSPTSQVESIHLWRGFARLQEHPRFREVAGWRKTLEKILAANIQGFRHHIVRVLERVWFLRNHRDPTLA